MRTGKGYVFRACYSKGVSHHHLSLGSEKAGRGAGKIDSRKRGWFQVCPDWRLLASRSCRQANKKADLCDWLVARIWLSLVGPKLEPGTKSRELSLFGPNCYRDYFGIPAEDGGWLPEPTV